jgi:hypothetical protein
MRATDLRRGGWLLDPEEGAAGGEGGGCEELTVSVEEERIKVGRHSYSCDYSARREWGHRSGHRPSTCAAALAQVQIGDVGMASACGGGSGTWVHTATVNKATWCQVRLGSGR